MRGHVQVTRFSFAFATLTLLTLPSVGIGQYADPDGVRFMATPQGNEARYVVREQLMGVDFPNDAVGKTSRIEGTIVIASNGSVVKDASRFTIDLASLKSDRDMRDNFLRRRTLQTEQHATAVFVPTATRNLKWPLPQAGNLNFQLLGELTVRGVTRPVTWNVVARSSNGALTGEAKTSFTFADFELEKPRVRSVLSVEDEIRLEYTFFLVPSDHVP